jgi:hypothetical protein
MDTKNDSNVLTTEQYNEDATTTAERKHDATLQLGFEESQAVARNPWKVLLENKKIFLLILAVQSNAIIVGVEFSMPGNLLGIPAFLKEV